MSGTLYLCATPIGNLEDITMRVLRVLQEVDLIAAEDTRNSIRLLNHFDIHTPLTSYHEYNKIEKAYVLIEEMKKGKDIALITDAGTPGISDPGFFLAREAAKAGITVQCLPGATAFVPAIVSSGLPCDRFCFEGFLPQKKGRMKQLQALAGEERTMIFYESPYRVVRCLEQFAEVDPKSGAPKLACVVLGVITVVGPFLGKNMLIPLTNVSALAFIFSCGMVALACLRMRFTEPDLPRPYEVPGGKFGIGLAIAACAIIIGLLVIPFSPASLNMVEWSIVIGWLAVGLALMAFTNSRKK